MRKVILGVAFLFILTTTVQAASLTELCTQALSTNHNCKMAVLNVKLAELGVVDAKAQDLLQASIVHITDAKQKLTAAKRNLAVVEQEVIFAVSQCYYNLVKLEKQAIILQQAEQIALEQLNIVKVRHEAGLATSLDKKQANIVVEKSKMEIAKVEGQMQVAQQKMLTLLGTSTSTEIKTNDADFQYQECSLVNLEQDSLQKQLMQHNPSLAAIMERVNLAKLEEKTGQITNLPPLYQELNSLQLELIEFEYENSLAQLLLHALDLQVQLQQAGEIYQLRLQEVEVAAKNHSIIQMRLSEGLETELGTLQAENSLQKAKLAKLAALCDYNVLKSQLENMFLVRE